MILPSVISDWAERLTGGCGPASMPSRARDGLSHRLVLFINHLLLGEPQARERLRQWSGHVVRVEWRNLALDLEVTGAGLCRRVPAGRHDLLVTLAEASPAALARDAWAGRRPPLRIEGESGLAQAVGWLVDHLRWDAEEDLARRIGDAPAHTLAAIARRAAAPLRRVAPGRTDEGPVRR